MCGFAGEFVFGRGRADLDVARRMAGRLVHRGPDEEGHFLCPDGRCAIGFRRLIVIDPEGSRQPMTSPDRRLTVAFNGEIYNFLDLRRQLAQAGCRLTSAGDTEVLLHLYRLHGPGMLGHLEGMFAFAVYDAAAGRLFLARDRLGEKPLWYSVLPDRLVFGSEAKALAAHPGVRTERDNAAVTFYLTIGYVPAPRTVWTGILKLSPAHFLLAGDGAGQPERYWSPEVRPVASGQAERLELVRGQVGAAVGKCLTADVPLGALLSGGVDSSIVTALAARQCGPGGLRTFTAGFEDANYDERPAARLVAKHCRTEHTELTVQANPAEAIERIVSSYDEPFADSSALPTFLICQAAREHVTAALTGDGGDEAFGGYDRYRGMRLAEAMGPAKYLLVRLAAGLVRPWAGLHERKTLRRFLRFADALPYPFAEQYLMYRRLFGPDDLRLLLADEFQAGVTLTEASEWFTELYEGGDVADEVTRAQRHDLLTYLPDDLLVKTDIASMACSLEVRSPLLNHNVVSMGLSLPVEAKVSRTYGKAILREAFGGLLPREVFNRPKRGFGVPLGRWLREELRPIVRETLLSGDLRRFGVFRPEAVAALVQEHFSGRADHSHRIWAVLVLARWLHKHG